MEICVELRLRTRGMTRWMQNATIYRNKKRNKIGIFLAEPAPGQCLSDTWHARVWAAKAHGLADHCTILGYGPRGVGFWF